MDFLLYSYLFLILMEKCYYSSKIHDTFSKEPMENEDEFEQLEAAELPPYLKSVNIENAKGMHREKIISLLRALNPGTKIHPSKATNDTEWDSSKMCMRNEDCHGDEACNIYRNQCERCSIENDLCRRDENCCDGRKCIWGRCMDVDFLKLCENTVDCKPGHCCAREEGQSVCKKYLQLGDFCKLPLGGLGFSIRHECPCKPGLFCRMRSNHQRTCGT